MSNKKIYRSKETVQCVGVFANAKEALKAQQDLIPEDIGINDVFGETPPPIFKLATKVRFKRTENNSLGGQVLR